MTTTPTDTRCPSWCTGIDHEGLAGGLRFHTGDLTDGMYVGVGLQLHDEPSTVMSLWCHAGTDAEQAVNDAWYFAADPQILRGIARDLTRAAEAMERGL